MKNLWHFGDSYGTGEWGDDLARKLKLNHIQCSKGGQSNYQILFDIIKYMNEINEGDLVLINWSFMSRGTIMDINSKRGISLNNFYDDENKQITDIAKQKVIQFIDYNINNTFQMQSALLFLASEIQNRLVERGVDVRSVFVKKELKKMGKNIIWPTHNFGLIELDFGEYGYIFWLKKMGYCGMDNEEDRGSENAHIKKGHTDIISEEYKKRIENGEKRRKDVQIL